MLTSKIYFAVAASLTWTLAHAQVSDCSGVERWPTSSAYAQIKAAGIAAGAQIDFTKTKTTRLASEEIRTGLFRQLHLVVFTETSGTKIEVITTNDASMDECSMSAV